MKWDVVNIEGKKVREIDLPDDIFAVEMNEHVLHLAVKAYRANRRQGTHATKTRSLVSGGGKKPFRQKGTGNARQGSTRGPHMYGGAVAHGPQPRDYTQQLNKKVKQLALKVALSDRVANNKLVILEDFALSQYSTKHVAKLIASVDRGSKVVFSDERKDDFLFRSAKNIYGSKAVSPSQINAEDVLGHEAVVLSETALQAIQQRFKGGDS